MLLLTSSVYEGRLRRFQKMKIHILYRDIVLIYFAILFYGPALGSQN